MLGSEFNNVNIFQTHIEDRKSESLTIVRLVVSSLLEPPTGMLPDSGRLTDRIRTFECRSDPVMCRVSAYSLTGTQLAFLQSPWTGPTDRSSRPRGSTSFPSTARGSSVSVIIPVPGDGFAFTATESSSGNATAASSHAFVA